MRTKTTTEKVRLGDIIIDAAYQIRHKIDTSNIGKYASDMKRGDKFPPIVVERSTGKLVCGFTRMEAYKKVFSPDTDVCCIFKDFVSIKDRIFFAAKDNDKHGQPLGYWDKKNIVSRLVDVSVSLKDVSERLGWKYSTVKKIAGMTVIVVDYQKGREIEGKDKKKSTKRGRPKKEEAELLNAQEELVDSDLVFISRPIKGGLDHLVGKTVSQEVYNNIVNHYVGWTCRFIADQLLMRIDDDTLNMEDGETVLSLKTLGRKLTALFKMKDKK